MEMIRQFANAILHGDAEHREWLLEAAEAFIAGKPMPPPRSVATPAGEDVGKLREAVLPLIEAATGLSFGEDWNGGTHARLHGYRQKLLDAIPAAREALGLDVRSTPLPASTGFEPNASDPVPVGDAIREAKAKAWEEGYVTARRNPNPTTHIPNPYNPVTVPAE